MSTPRTPLTSHVFAQAPFVRHFAAALAAGFTGAFVSSPFDVVKSRVMNQALHPATGRGLLYNGTWHCVVASVRAEGVASLWKVRDYVCVF